jgi:hypothetical protein
MPVPPLTAIMTTCAAGRGAAFYTFDQVADFVQDQSVIGLKQRHQINSVFQRFWKRVLSGNITHHLVIPEEMNAVAHINGP